MRALVWDDGLRLVESYPDPMPGPGEVLIRPRLSGICNTDVELTRGYLSHRGVLGHEFVGLVVRAPDAAWVGMRCHVEVVLKLAALAVIT